MSIRGLLFLSIFGLLFRLLNSFYRLEIVSDVFELFLAGSISFWRFEGVAGCFVEFPEPPHAFWAVEPFNAGNPGHQISLDS